MDYQLAKLGHYRALNRPLEPLKAILAGHGAYLESLTLWDTGLLAYYDGTSDHGMLPRLPLRASVGPTGAAYPSCPVSSFPTCDVWPGWGLGRLWYAYQRNRVRGSLVPHHLVCLRVARRPSDPLSLIRAGPTCYARLWLQTPCHATIVNHFAYLRPPPTMPA